MERSIVHDGFASEHEDFSIHTTTAIGRTLLPNGGRWLQFYSTENYEVRPVGDVAMGATVTALWVNGIVCVVLLLLYAFMSTRLPSVYARTSEKLSGNPLVWAPAILRIPWTRVRNAGLDAYMFCRYLRMCLVFTSVAGVWGILALFPLYATSTMGKSGWYYLSMANIDSDFHSYKLHGPAIFMWFLTFFVFYLMNEEFKHYSELRSEFLAGMGRPRGKASQDLYSVVIENVPHSLRSDYALHQYFEALVPGKVHSANVVMIVPDLEALCARRRRVLRRLEKAIAVFEATGRRATHVAGSNRMSCFGIETQPLAILGKRRQSNDNYDERLPRRGERVDSIHYYTRDLVDMNEKIAAVQAQKMRIATKGNEMLSPSERLASTFQKIRQDGLVLGFRDLGSYSFVVRVFMGFIFGGLSLLEHHIDVMVDTVERNDMSSYGFVTFKDLSTVTCIASTRCASPSTLTVRRAPEPRDIIWKNAHIDAAVIAGREFTANSLLVLGVIFWSVPVASIQGLATIESVAKIPGLEWMAQFSEQHFGSFINGYLPVLALLGLINLLPFIFSWIARHYENRKTESDVDASILKRFFYYQLANIYITVTAASLFEVIGDAIDNPLDVLSSLGQTLPTVVGYFIALLFTKILAGLPFVLLRPGALSRRLLIYLCFREDKLTQREIDEVYKPQMLFYGWEYPTQLLVIVICFTYACISPVILPVGALYFFLALIVYKKQVLLVYSATYEGGGNMFPVVCDRTLVGLCCGQVTLLGYMLIRQGFAQFLMLFPLPFITMRMMRNFEREYSIPSDLLSLERAKEIDSHFENMSSEFDKNLYRQPSLSDAKGEPMPYRRASFEAATSSVSSGGGVGSSRSLEFYGGRMTTTRDPSATPLILRQESDATLMTVTLGGAGAGNDEKKVQDISNKLV